MSQVIRISLLIAASLATLSGWRRKYSLAACTRLLVEALRMLRKHVPDSCLSLLVSHRLIRNVSVLIAVAVSCVLFPNIALGGKVLTEKLFF